MPPIIQAHNLTKEFKIPHEKIDSLRGGFVNLFKKKSFEKFKALDDVSFEVNPGEFFGIIGRNGSGKSTLLKTLAGIYEPDSGRLENRGSLSPFLELGVGFNPELSGKDNIYLNGSILGLSPKEIKEKYPKIVAFSELERFIDQKLKNYSSGMQVRLAFSVAIHANKDILLMDEVLAVGDYNFQEKCLKEFRRLHKEGKTIILVSHDSEVIKRYCERALLLRNGKVEKIGPARQVLNEYSYQNLSDEEKRILDEAKKNKAELQQKISNGQDWLKDVAKISSVEFLNAQNQKQHAFTTGADLKIRIHYDLKQSLKHPVFGVSLDAKDGRHIIGPNTKKSKLELPSLSGQGFVDLILKNLPLNFGLYFVTVGLFNKEENITFDFLSKKYSFQVTTIDPGQDDLTHVDYEWRTGNSKALS